MGFLNTLLIFIQDFFESIFSSSSPEYKKKHLLKQLSVNLRAMNPQLYRQDGFLLPAFPTIMYQIYQFTHPIKEILKTTLENSDRRIAERCRDYLIELTFTDEQRQARKSFTFTERSIALAAQNENPEKLIENQGKQFALFQKYLDSPSLRPIGQLLEKIDFLIDFTEFDFNGFFSYFDPAFKLYSGKDGTVETPSFHAVEIVSIIPVLLDIYYLLAKLEISPALIEIISILDAKRLNVPLGEDIKSRINRIFQAIVYLLEKKLNKDVLLSIIRLTKEDPDYQPEQPHNKTDYIQQYKNRITEFFHNDSRKLVKEKQENIIQTLIAASFGNRKLETLNGYSEETNALLQEFTPFSLEWIKPLEILKTFTMHFFEPHIKQILQSVIVEGFFHNRSLQSSSATAYYYCESIMAKMTEFEKLFNEKETFSLKIITGYLTELEKGKDFEKPLRKMIENINNHAKSFIQQAVTQYAEVYSFSLLILEDNKKSIPEYITNMRNLSISTKNADSFGWLEKETDVFRNFLEIMKKYAIIGTLSVSASLTDQTES